MELVSERALLQSQIEHANIYVNGKEWMCPICRNDQGRLNSALVCFDLHEYVEVVGEDKQAKVEKSTCLRAVCPNCANEFTRPFPADFACSFVDNADMMRLFNNPLRPAWCIPTREWQEAGALANPAANKGSIGPITLALHNIMERVENIRSTYNPNYVKKSVSLPEMAHEEPNAVNCPSSENSEQVEASSEDAEIYEIYDPWEV